MLKIISDPQFTVDVEVDIAGAGPSQTLRTTFRAISDDEMADHDVNTAEGFKLFLRRVIVAFHDLVDDAEQPVAYTEGLRDEVLSFIHIRNALNRAYFAALFKARAKN